jgi:hypothetical protein
MAEEKVVEVVEKVAPSKVKYFKSRLHGLRVIVDDSSTDPTMITYEQMIPVKSVFQGDPIKTGYIKTSTPRVVKALTDMSEVVEITEKEYEEAVK